MAMMKSLTRVALAQPSARRRNRQLVRVYGLARAAVSAGRYYALDLSRNGNLSIHHLLGVRPDIDHLLIRPRLLSELKSMKARFGFTAIGLIWKYIVQSTPRAIVMANLC
jgi:hypothetical protein